MASLWAAFAYWNTGQPALSDSIDQTLNRRRGQLAPLDRLLLDYQLDDYRADKQGALEAMRRFVEIAPGSEFLYKAGSAALGAGRPREALGFLTQADPESGWLRGWFPYWLSLTGAYHKLGDYERQLEAAHRFRQLHPGKPGTLRSEMRALAGLGRIEELGARIPEAIQHSSWPRNLDWIGELRFHGYPAAASDLVDRTLEWFEGRTSDWKQDSRQSYVYAKVLSQAGRWDRSQVVLEDIFEVLPPPPPSAHCERPYWCLHNEAPLELAYVLARQGHRDQAFRAVGLTEWTTDLVVRAWVEAALGERERAVGLLRESGPMPDMHTLALRHHVELLLDYPPFQELMRPKG